jgi:hypothetical protein
MMFITGQHLHQQGIIESHKSNSANEKKLSRSKPLRRRSAVAGFRHKTDSLGTGHDHTRDSQKVAFATPKKRPNEPKSPISHCPPIGQNRRKPNESQNLQSRIFIE